MARELVSSVAYPGPWPATSSKGSANVVLKKPREYTLPAGLRPASFPPQKPPLSTSELLPLIAVTMPAYGISKPCGMSGKREKVAFNIWLIVSCGSGEFGTGG